MARSFVFRGAGLAALAVMTLACSHASVTVLKKYPRRPDGYPIFLTEGDIKEPYEEIATVRSPAYDEWEARERGEGYLRTEARRAGGDAVIWVKREPSVKERFGFHPTGTFRAGTTLETTFSYTGTVARYVREGGGDEGARGNVK